MCTIDPQLCFTAMLRGLHKPKVTSDPRLRSGDEDTTMQAAIEIVAAGDDALREQQEALCFEFQDIDPEVRRRLTIGLQCLVAACSGRTLAEIREWQETMREQSEAAWGKRAGGESEVPGV